MLTGVLLASLVLLQKIFRVIRPFLIFIKVLSRFYFRVTARLGPFTKRTLRETHNVAC
ncbi:hypothetical protein FHW72_004294 [Ochrobactrum sp. RC6B]|nr:hypothetical protein [Ochrobactrum sp. RC6B]